MHQKGPILLMGKPSQKVVRQGQVLINDRFTLLNRSFIENKTRSAVINVSRTSGRLYSFVLTTVQFIAWYSQGTRPLLLLAE